MTIDYATWYNSWMKLLALNYTRAELEVQLHGAGKASKKNSAAHLRAIESGSRGSGQTAAARTVHASNVSGATGDYLIALRGALEIYELFPKETKEAPVVVDDWFDDLLNQIEQIENDEAMAEAVAVYGVLPP